MDKRNSKKEK